MTRFRGEYVKDRKALHNAVRAEAGNRCVRCGHPQGDRMMSNAELAAGLEYDELAPGRRIEERFEKDRVRFVGFVLTPCTEHCTHPKDGKLRILTVHHLTGQKDDNRWWNLLALCQVCHLQVQGKVIPEQAYLHPHSPWFVPYVCGFYAATIGGEDITREQADADPHRYLRLGQPWLYSEDA